MLLVRQGPSVSLTEVLHGREMRAERQRGALARFGRPVASLTLVMPGPHKDSPLARYLFELAIGECYGLFRARGWQLPTCVPVLAATGPEALYVVEAHARELKQALVALEESHPLGRLWDIDVIDPDAGPVARASLGLPARRCLVCEEPAHACARSRRHPLDEVLQFIEEKVDAYRRGRPA